LNADGTALIDGAECAAGFEAAAADLDAAARIKIGYGSARATDRGEAGLALCAEGLAIATSSLGEDELALYPRSMKKAGE
jgi:hypothetical protein